MTVSSDTGPAVASRERIIVICGATASRKSELAMALATEVQGELVCCDSVQMVRGFVIGSAAPSSGDYAAVPHHLFQSVEWNDPPDAGRYQSLADEAIHQIIQRDKVPIVVGGTGLYLRSLLFGLANIPTVPANVREALRAELEVHGANAMYQRLERLDGIAARRISGGARNTQRVLRALEVAVHTGRPLSSYWAEQSQTIRYHATILMPEFDTQTLAHRISKRVESMLSTGLVDEVRALLSSGVDPMCRAMRSLGYREVVHHLDTSEPLEVTQELIERGHRRYARRQRTWFRAMDDIHVLDATRTDLLQAALRLLDTT